MPRPRLGRRVSCEPRVRLFKPAGIPARQLERVELRVEEVEALRLAFVEGLSQSEAAERVGVSQPTFSRLLSSAEAKAADAIVNGKVIIIEGGNYFVEGRGRGMGRGFGRGRGRRRF